MQSSTIFPCFASQDEPGPGQYDAKELGKPEPSKRPPYGSSAERMNRHARRFFLGSSVRYFVYQGHNVLRFEKPRHFSPECIADV